MAASRKIRRAGGSEDDPGGVLGLVGRFARQLPGAEFAEEQYHNLESRALRELKTRLESVDDRRLPAPEGYRPARLPPAEGGIGRHPGSLLADLLARSGEQTQAEAELALYARILRELVPDEARILALLANGKPQPLIHLGLGSPIGTPRRVAENYSNLGKSAALKLRDMAPVYIGHLRAMGLLETGPEDRDFNIQYQVIESDRKTREVGEAAAKGSPPGFGIRYMRRVVLMTELGKALWQACQPDAGQAG